MNKLVVFDLDGTLIDSLPDIVISINAMLKKFGHKTREYNEIKRFIGNGAKKLVEDALDQTLCEKEFNTRLEYYNNLYTSSSSPNTKVFDGIMEVLRELKEKGIKLAIITNKPQETTDSIIKNHFTDFKFDAVIGQRPNQKKKPNKETTEQLLKTFNVHKDNACFIGDGETDVQTAINAGIRGVAVLWGYRCKEDLQKAGATCFALSPCDLPSLIGF